MQQSQYRIMARLESTHWWFLAKRKFIKSVLPLPTGNLRILDVGCGTGGTSTFLRQWGKVTCIEQSPFAFSYLNKSHIPYIATSIEDYSHRKHSFDLVCILDVLYHKNIHDDQKVLERIYELLHAGGILCITDCALPFLFSHHDVVMKARTRYSLNELVSKVEASGFRITRASYTYFFVFPFFIMQRLLNKFIPFSTVRRISPTTNRILLFICSIEAYFLRQISFPIGSSLIILAEKL